MQTLAIVTLGAASALPEDNVQNTFVFECETGFEDSEVDQDALITSIIGFYNTATTTAYSVSKMIGASISRAANACEVALYDITGKLGNRGPGANGKEQGPPPHGSPFNVQMFQLATEEAGYVQLPGECSVCLTLRANTWEAAAVEAPDGSDSGTATDRPRQRLSGRLFVPRLNALFLEVVSGKALFKDAGRTTLMDAADVLADSARTGIGAYWSVWSRQTASVNPITHVQVDNEFDIQRRRGYTATVRDQRTVWVP